MDASEARRCVKTKDLLPPVIVARMAATVLSASVPDPGGSSRRSTISTSGHARFVGRMTSGPEARTSSEGVGPTNAREKPSTLALVDITSRT
jgi:hypothetical protein